jgi:hypothetical protein
MGRGSATPAEVRRKKTRTTAARARLSAATDHGQSSRKVRHSSEGLLTRTPMTSPCSPRFKWSRFFSVSRQPAQPLHQRHSGGLPCLPEVAVAGCGGSWPSGAASPVRNGYAPRRGRGIIFTENNLPPCCRRPTTPSGPWRPASAACQSAQGTADGVALRPRVAVSWKLPWPSAGPAQPCPPARPPIVMHKVRASCQKTDQGSADCKRRHASCRVLAGAEQAVAHPGRMFNNRR